MLLSLEARRKMDDILVRTCRELEIPYQSMGQEQDQRVYILSNALLDMAAHIVRECENQTREDRDRNDRW